jgi:hypothetical protein
MARASQVVMVGDPKQLPPTSFFGRAETSDEDSPEVEGDMESILDECLGASLPTRNLSWHYRSRHESLIAFSNHRYYGGGLVTFPSPVTDDRAVSFHAVPGRYEKGGARINQPEAKALVADLVGRLRSPGFREAGTTIGVVTFNAEQQSLIEDLLDEERRKDPELESFFSDAQLEPVFVKNLESVQGDERDIMYFSITYGPDISGAVSMNFGPLNRARWPSRTMAARATSTAPSRPASPRRWSARAGACTPRSAPHPSAWTWVLCIRTMPAATWPASNAMAPPTTAQPRRATATSCASRCCAAWAGRSCASGPPTGGSIRAARWSASTRR